MLLPRCLIRYSALVFRAVHARSTQGIGGVRTLVRWLVEHLVIRRGDFARYHVEAEISPRKLPPGIAAIFSGTLGIGIVVLYMEQVNIHLLTYCYFFLSCNLKDLNRKPSA